MSVQGKYGYSFTFFGKVSFFSWSALREALGGGEGERKEEQFLPCLGTVQHRRYLFLLKGARKG